MGLSKFGPQQVDLEGLLKGRQIGQLTQATKLSFDRDCGRSETGLPLGLQARSYHYGYNHGNSNSISWDMGPL